MEVIAIRRQPSTNHLNSMKKHQHFTFLLLFFAFLSAAQNDQSNRQYEPSPEHPYGQLNPTTPPQVADFAPLIGICDCRSLPRNADGTWPDTTNMVWSYKYIMNGTAVQDEVWRENDRYAGSIRQYQPDSAHWVVTYFSYPTVSSTPSVWHGNKVGNDIVLRMPQKAPNGMDGKYRISFYEMSEEGFKWKGEWVNLDESFTYPTWFIECKKRE